MLRRFAAELRARTLGQIQKESKDALLLQGRIASWLVRSKETVTSLRDVEFKVLSQFGEDGIIDWIIERSQIPDHCTVSSSSGGNCMRKRIRDSFWKTEIGVV